MKIQRTLLPLMMGLSLVAALILAVGWQAGKVFARESEYLPEEEYFQSLIRYVAPTGEDAGNCTGSNAPCQTIQYAVDQAVGGDEIWIASLDNITAARYTGTTANVIALSKSLTLRGGYIYSHLVPGFASWTPSPIPAPAPVDGQGIRRPLRVSGNVSPSLELLAFVNGSASQGGNVYAEDASLRFIATPILSGTASQGGGLYLKVCQVSFDPGGMEWGALAGISGLLLVANNSADYGGGIYVEGGSPALVGLAVYSNTAVLDGGGFFLDGGKPVVAGGLLLENRAGDRGGGFFLLDSGAVIIESAVYSNTAETGAGFYLDGPLTLSFADWPIIANNMVRYNRAADQEYGGGFYFELAVAGLVNNIVADNQAADGSAVYLWGSSPLLYHNTISQNQGDSSLYLTHQPGQIWPPILPVPSLPSLVNSIISSETIGVYVDSTGLPYPFQNRATLDGTLWWANGTDGGGAGEIVSSNEVFGDPRFTCTGVLPDCLFPYHIMTDSMAVDRGVEPSSSVPGLDLLLDIDGQLRPSGGGYDIGADEVMSSLYDVWLFPPLSILSSEPGRDVTHTHRLMNTGTETDTYDLAYSSSTGWSTLLALPVITLAAQTSATVQSWVMVPPTATGDMQDTLLITATSRGDANQQAWALDLTTVLDAAAADLAVGKWADRQQVMPGGALTFTVVVTNIGPMTETMVVTLTDRVLPSYAVTGIAAPGDICGVDLIEGLISCTWSMPAGTPPLSHAIPIVITVSETYSGLLVNTATVAGSFPDPNPGNNMAVVVVAVQEAMQVYMPLIRRAVIPPTLPPPVPVTGTPPIDFETIREQLQANGQDLAFVKVGFHVGFGITPTVHPVYTYLAELDAAGVPFFLKTVDNAEPVYIAQEMMRASGVSHTLVYRKSGLGWDWPDYTLSPQEAAQGHWDRHRDAFPPELDPDLVWIETVNEVNKDHADWLAEFALETAQLALADEFRWAAFGWASGEPEPEHWDTPVMLEFLRLAGQYPDRLAIALHEYSYTVDDIAHQYPYLVGRVQALFDICDQNWIPRPTILISEWGWEYQNIPPVPEAMEDIAWASWLYAAYPQIRGAAIWFLGTGDEWGDIRYQVAELLEPMSYYARSSYFVIGQGWGAIDPELFRPPAGQVAPR